MKSYFRGSVVLCWITAESIRQYASLATSGQPITSVVSQLVQAYVSRLFAQAQLEETRYSVSLREDGIA